MGYVKLHAPHPHAPSLFLIKSTETMLKRYFYQDAELSPIQMESYKRSV